MILKLLLLGVVASAAKDLPAPFIHPCARDDPQFNACALKSAKIGIPIVAKGDKKFGIPPLNPLTIPEIKVLEGPFSLNLKNLVLYGLDKAVPETCNFDFERKNFSLQFTIPEFKIVSQYTINGRILLLPITGSGDLNCTMINGKLSINHGFELKKINGVDHQKLINMKARFEPQRVYLALTNLFNGDKALGSHMNTFLDENWRDVYKELAPTIESTFEKVIASVLTSVNDIIPFDEVFPKTLSE